MSATLEKLTFAQRALASAPRNRAFQRRYPDFPVPPLYLLWDAQVYTDYATYKAKGEESAALYWELIRAYAGPCGSGELRVCESGCGPGRIIRHLPGLSRDHPCRFRFYGTDYNERSIEWCRRHLPNVTFELNQLGPPLEFADGFFDLLYCRSVFTHLSEAMHYAWMRELSRVVRPGGVMMISTKGDSFRQELLEDEQRRFDQGEVVVRGLADEGKLMFMAAHSPRFVREKLLRGLEILEHREGKGVQDIWIVRNSR